MKDNIFKKFNYDFKKYNFREFIENLYGTKDLEQLHLIKPSLLPKKNWLEFKNESQTDFHKIFYNRLNSNWSNFLNYMRGSFLMKFTLNLMKIFYINMHQLLERKYQTTKQYTNGIMIVIRIIIIL